MYVDDTDIKYRIHYIITKLMCIYITNWIAGPRHYIDEILWILRNFLTVAIYL